MPRHWIDEIRGRGSLAPRWGQRIPLISERDEPGPGKLFQLLFQQGQDMRAPARLVIPIHFLRKPQVVVPERHRFGYRAVRQIGDHEHQITITHQIAMLFTVLTQRHQAVPVLTDADLLDRKGHVARYRNTHRTCTAEQLIQIRRKGLIQFHHRVPFFRCRKPPARGPEASRDGQRSDRSAIQRVACLATTISASRSATPKESEFFQTPS